MNPEKLTHAGREQLSLILSFFPRVESKSSVLLAIDTSMLGFMAAKAPRWQEFSVWMAVFDIMLDPSKISSKDFGNPPSTIMWNPLTWSAGKAYGVETIYGSNWTWTP